MDGTRENSARRADQASRRASSGPAVGHSRAGKGRLAVTSRLSCPSQHGALQTLSSPRRCRKAQRGYSCSRQAGLRAHRSPLSSDRPVRPSAPAAPAWAPPQSSESLCLQPGRHCRNEARAPPGTLRSLGSPGVTWLPGPWWREASHPCRRSLLRSVLPSLQPESQSSSPAWSPGGAASCVLGPRVGRGQGRSSLAMASSRMSGGRNSRPRRYSSSPWRQAGRDDQIPPPGPLGEAPGQPGASERQGQRGF